MTFFRENSEWKNWVCFIFFYRQIFTFSRRWWGSPRTQFFPTEHLSWWINNLNPNNYLKITVLDIFYSFSHTVHVLKQIYAARLASPTKGHLSLLCFISESWQFLASCGNTEYNHFHIQIFFFLKNHTVFEN